MAEVADEYALRLHLTFSGNVALGSSYVPYAKAKLRDLLRNGGDLYQVKSYTPQPGVLVRIRLENEQRFVHIEAVTGCKDRKSFLMSRRGQGYDALYNDGTLENINPIEGKPRPDPDPAEFTKGYKVPQDLRRLGLSRTSASKYSGLMRMVVGCYHLAGKESPFSYGHAVTHGIVKKTFTESGKEVTKYWVVEIRPEGVFAAPITNSGKCCDSWSVSTYMPRPPTTPGQPPPPKPTTLSLRTRFVSKDPRVQQMLSAGDMAVAYADGTPFWPDHGWAFSASGAEAQCVVQVFVGIPPNHYECSRWKIVFTGPSGGSLGATLQMLETHKKTSFKRNSIVWTPVSSGVWSGSFGAAPSIENPVGSLPSQEAPVAVYYVGETEQVLRWTYTYQNVATVDNRPLNTIPTTVVPGITGCPHSAANPGPSTVSYHIEALHSAQIVNAHIEELFGFYCPAFSHVARGDQYITTRWDLNRGTMPDAPIQGPTADSQPLDPACYYFDGAGHLVTSCFYNYEWSAEDRNTFWYNQFDGNEGHNHVSAVVLFAEERETFMGVRWDNEVRSGNTQYVIGGTYRFGWICKRVRQTKTDAGPCPYTEWIYEQSDSQFPCNVSPVIPPSYTAPFSYDSRSASAVMVVSDHVATAPITIGPPPWFIYGNYNLATFLECNPTTKPNAESNVRAMHGNLYYADDKLTPPNQSSNMVYLLDNAQVVIGGFPDPADPVGFVGRA